MIKKENYNIPGAKGRGMLMDITFDDTIKHAPLVIFAHGFKGFKDWGAHNLVANYYAEQGFRYLKFNFSHNGTTVDEPKEFADLIAFSDNTFSIELEDLHDVIDFVCNGSSMPKVSGVYLVGHSLGGGISIIQTSEDSRVKKLVTMAAISALIIFGLRQQKNNGNYPALCIRPINAPGRICQLKSTMLDDLKNNPGRLDILAKAEKIEQPWLIVHGDEDTTVPLSHAEDLHEANQYSELIVIKGADHTFNATQPYTKDSLPKQLLEFS